MARAAEQDQLEEEYFSNDELFIELLDAKDQLTSDYLVGRLAPADRERYEKRFLALPDCRRDVELDCFLQPTSVQNSLTRQSMPREDRPHWWQVISIGLRVHRPLAGAAIAALLIIGAVGLWLALRPSSEKNRRDLGQASPTAPAGPIIVSLALRPGRLRSEGEVPKAVIGASTQAVELRLEVGTENYARYQAGLQRVDEGNTEVMADSSLKAEPTAGKQRTVTWKVPAAKLLIGDYQVKLSGVSADSVTDHIGDYHFKVRDQ